MRKSFFIPLFLGNLEQTGLYELVACLIFSLRTQIRKGLELQKFIKLILAFFVVGTDAISHSIKCLTSYLYGD